MESSQQIISILHSLQSEGLLGKLFVIYCRFAYVEVFSLTPNSSRNIPLFRSRVHLRLDSSPPHRTRHRRPLELPAMGRKSIHNLRRHHRERQLDRQVPALRVTAPR
jgi:hypothetical protein